MTEMVERVARAIHKAALGSGVNEDDAELFWQETRLVRLEQARAAIVAMEHPTQAMRKVCSFQTAEVEYPAMIRAAL